MKTDVLKAMKLDMIFMQVALELGSERVLWTSNGIAPHSVDDPGVGKAFLQTAFLSARCSTLQRGHQDACASNM